MASAAKCKSDSANNQVSTTRSRVAANPGTASYCDGDIGSGLRSQHCSQLVMCSLLQPDVARRQQTDNGTLLWNSKSCWWRQSVLVYLMWARTREASAEQLLPPH